MNDVSRPDRYKKKVKKKKRKKEEMDGWKQNKVTRERVVMNRNGLRDEDKGRNRGFTRTKETMEGTGMEKKELTGNIFECLFNHNYH